VHRDIKPANLMELTDGSVRICDFGIARYSDATAQLTATGGLLGTPAFMAPELYEGKPADARSDLYAFGCTLHALLAGEPPFSAPSLASLMRQHLVEPPPKLPALRPGIPADLDELLQALLAKDPSHRPTGRDVMGALEDVLSPNTDRTRRASTWNRQPTQATEHPPPMPGSLPMNPGQRSHPSFPNAGQPAYGQQSHPSFPQMPQPAPPPFQQSHPSFPQMPQPAAYAQPSGYVQGQPAYAPVSPYRPVALPYGEIDPRTGQVLSDKSKLTAGLLQIFLGGFGVGRFYTGHAGMAIGQIAVTWLTCGVGALWPLIDGIVILCNGGTDAQGRKLRD
jgi:serine/threonine protein kinase